ncbi:ricin-type beta-trefoil lectin domain protein [Streptomyces yunnanensis]|uniref:Ricin-type beta-trefoil lectin domain-like n=1 Tax=Streptomyces yunnanensis TaxID=156453 RepID=A0A9X8N8S6_9ACTN|nr:ricin-type beta-trefoil lectin domain protein [Streptomyces yunnanensis]SHN29730.1 hypothetical protein SAMN05216268_13144 [Streptomyces yunnanensis]
MNLKVRSALVAGMLAAATVAGTAGTAQANTYQYNVMLQDYATGYCLDSNGGDVYTNPCQPGNPWQRWNVVSYDGSVGGYYDRVQIVHRKEGNCLRVQWSHSISDPSGWFATRAAGCNSSDYHDQWNMTWVGNSSGNPRNSWQFANYQADSNLNEVLCLDRGQDGHYNQLLWDQGHPQGAPVARTTCYNHTNRYQMWNMVH